MTDAPTIPEQHQDAMPADEWKMDPEPDYTPRHPGTGKLKDKVALVTGGDSGIGRAVSVLFAREGARVAIAYLDEDRDAEETKRLVEAEGSEALLLPGDIADRDHAFDIVRRTVERFDQLDVLINNAAEQFYEPDFEKITEANLRRTFDSNVIAQFFVTQAALPHLKEGAAIVYTSSINAFKGNAALVDYSSTRGATLALSRSMAQQLAPKGIRVNTVAPGPVWTPFIVGSMPEEKMPEFGQQVPLGRPGQPWEIATSYLFLASSDGSYFSGQTLHPNGGAIVGS